MGKRCARPACEAPATAGYNFDGLARVVWIIPIPETSNQCAGLLCRRHADAMTPPRSWEMRDMRPALPEHFAPAPSAPSRYMAPTPIAAGAYQPPVPIPAAKTPAALAAPPTALTEPTIPYSSVDDLDSEPDEEADQTAEPAGPYSPLLARAFRAAG